MKVFSCAPTCFSIRSPGFSLRGKFIPKITNYDNFGGSNSTSLKPATTGKFGVRVQTRDPSLTPLFLENSLKGIRPLGANYTKKLPVLTILGAVSPHF